MKNALRKLIFDNDLIWLVVASPKYCGFGQIFEIWHEGKKERKYESQKFFLQRRKSSIFFFPSGVFFPSF